MMGRVCVWPCSVSAVVRRITETNTTDGPDSLRTAIHRERTSAAGTQNADWREPLSDAMVLVPLRIEVVRICSLRSAGNRMCGPVRRLWGGGVHWGSGDNQYLVHAVGVVIL